MSKETKKELIFPLTIMSLCIIGLFSVNTTYGTIALVGVILFFAKVFLVDLPKVDAIKAKREKNKVTE